MKITEKINKGLEREISVAIAKADMLAKRDARLADLQGKIKINGFRPGKVPLAHITKLYGKSVMAELIDEIVRENGKDALEKRGEKAAQQPKITMTEDKAEAETMLTGQKDFEFTIAYEIIPDIKLVDFKKIKVEKQITKVPQSEIDTRLQDMAKNNVSYEEKKSAAEINDRIMFDYEGKIDGTAFDGGTDTNAHLVLGSKTFIPGFEEQLLGKKAGDETKVSVTFPKNYSAKHLANKQAIFDVLIHKVEKPIKTKLDDDFAKNLGVDNLAKLKTLIADQIDSQNQQQTRAKMKQQVINQLNEQHKFELPKKMVQQQFDAKWQDTLQQLEQNKKTFKDEKTTEEAEKKKCKALAEQFVRTSLLVEKIGENAKIEVTEQEIQQALQQQAAQFPGREKEIYDFFKQNPERINSLRAPIFEDKVISHILESATIVESGAGATGAASTGGGEKKVKK